MSGNLVQRLDAARRLIAGGWSEPYSLDADGRLCDATAEGVASLCLVDALQVACGGNVAQQLEAEEVLGAVLRVQSGESQVARWAAAPGRTQAEVVALLARATSRARVLGATAREYWPQSREDVAARVADVAARHAGQQHAPACWARLTWGDGRCAGCVEVAP